MNTTILKIPEEIVEYIISFTCDRRGYNMTHYNQRKRLDKDRMYRIITEIKHFNSLGYNISWLRPSCEQRKFTSLFIKSLKHGTARIFYHTGCYKGDWQENAEKNLIERQERRLRAILNR